MRILCYLVLLLTFGIASAQTATILQGDYISNVFGNSNFVLNPNAQTSNCTTSGTITCANVTVSSASITRSTTTPLVARTEFLMTTSTATGFADWALRTFDQGMKGQNCEARFTYKGFTVGTTTAQIHQGSNVVAQLTLTPSATDPRIASINFPCGDLSAVTKFRLQQASAALTGTNEIGGIYVGLATNMANVAQAQAIFRANDTNGASIAPATPTNVIFPATVFDADGGYNSTTGTYTIKRAGRYLVHARVAFAMLNPYPSGIDNYIQVMKNGASVATGFWSTGGAYGQYPNPQITSVVDFNVGDQINIVVQHTTGANRSLLGGNALWSDFTLSRFPSSSELVVTPERQNTWGAVEYRSSTQSLFSGSAEPTGYSSFNNATWNQPTLLKGKAAVTTTNSGNDLGFSIPNLPVGNYKLEISGELYAQPGSATVNDVTVCTFRIFETTTSSAIAEQVIQGGRPTSATNTANLTNSFQGIFNNTSVATRNFRLEANKTVDANATNLGTCVATSSAAGNVDATIISFTIIPLDQPSNSALYVQGPVKAAETGAAIPAGYVGEMLSADDGTYVNQTSATYSVLSLALTPGVWDVQGKCDFDRNGATVSAANWIASIVNQNLNPAEGVLSQFSGGAYVSSDAIRVLTMPTRVTWNGTTNVTPGSTNTSSNLIYIRCYPSTFTGGPVRAWRQIWARRVN